MQKIFHAWEKFCCSQDLLHSCSYVLDKLFSLIIIAFYSFYWVFFSRKLRIITHIPSFLIHSLKCVSWPVLVTSAYATVAASVPSALLLPRERGEKTEIHNSQLDFILQNIFEYLVSCVYELPKTQVSPVLLYVNNPLPRNRDSPAAILLLNYQF
jgi:hypothetical protein